MSGRHPTRTITREIRTRRPLHPGRSLDDQEAVAWPETLRVGDRMTRPVTTVRSDTLLSGAVELMRSRRIRHLPVVDRNRRLVGIVTDRDLRQVLFGPIVQARLAGATDALRDLTVGDVMTWGAVRVTPGTSVRHAGRVMHESKVGALPVVEADRVVGILTERDVLAAFREILDESVVSRPYRSALAYR